jgi:hypothetical protein
MHLISIFLLPFPLAQQQCRLRYLSKVTTAVLAVETTVEKVEVVVVVVVDRIQVAQKAEALQLNLLSFSARSTLSNCRNFLVSSCVPLGMKLQDSSLPPALGKHLL